MILPLELAGWLVFTIPLIGALLTPLFAKLHDTLRDMMAVLVGFLTAFVALDLLWSLVVSPSTIEVLLITWIQVGFTSIEFGVLIDPLSVLLAVIASGIGSLIILFSVGYMTTHDEEGKIVKDPSLTRYYGLMQLFVGGMVLLVMSNNLLQTFIGWEVVGLCSYALIGFWHNAKGASPLPEYETEGEYNAASGMKAFMVTRVGDIGFLAGILILFYITGTFNYLEILTIFENLASTPIPPIGIPADWGLLILVPATLILAGSLGKSAQFPLHIWLPEAMAGPTTVSALIHAAAMVKAGVFLIARLIPLFVFVYTGWPSLEPYFLLIAYIGAFTAFMAATVALIQDEIKKVLAYSTISQLGYMFIVLGASGVMSERVTAYSAGVYHLLAHALFKGLLFLAAGSVLHATKTKKMSEMGGLWSSMRVTGATFLVGALALAGVFPVIGFWSKELIFEALFLGEQWLLFIMAFVTAILTAFYTFRMVGMTFFGERSEHIRCLEEHGHHVHEAPKSMTIPLVILAIAVVLGGLTQLGFFTFFAAGDTGPGNVFHWSHMTPFALGLTTLFTLIVWVVGIVPAYLIYFKGRYDLSRFKEGSLYRFLENRWYFNALFHRVFVDGYLWLADLFHRRIEYPLLMLYDSVGEGMNQISRSWRRSMTGVLSTNVLGMMVGIIAFLLILLFV